MTVDQRVIPMSDRPGGSDARFLVQLIQKRAGAADAERVVAQFEVVKPVVNGRAVFTKISPALVRRMDPLVARVKLVAGDPSALGDGMLTLQFRRGV